MNQVLDTIFNAGDDALAYEYQVNLGGIPYLDTVTNLFVRTTTVEIPPKVAGTYTYNYKSETIVKPNGRNESAKEFSMELRIDKYFLLYKALRLWNDVIINPITGGSSMDSINGVSAIRIPITVTTGTYDILGNFVPTLQAWAFTGCFPSEIGGFSLDNTSGEPLTCSIKWNFLKMI
jgi:hypothetical protein